MPAPRPPEAGSKPVIAPTAAASASGSAGATAAAGTSAPAPVATSSAAAAATAGSGGADSKLDSKSDSKSTSDDNFAKPAECIWLGAQITRSKQIEALKLVYDLARQYCAAAKSVQTNRSFQAAHAVVMACMVAVTDAIIRIHATDKISMITYEPITRARTALSSLSARSLVAMICVDVNRMVLNGTDHLAKKVRAEEEDPTQSLDIFNGTSPARDYLVDNKGGRTPIANLKGKIVAIYFSAHWCPPCRELTPQIIDIYNALRITDPDKQFELVFVSADKDEVAFNNYFGDMPWLAIPYSDGETRSRLEKRFKVKGYPTLIMLDEDARMYTNEGRKVIMDGWPFGRPELSADDRAALNAKEAEAKGKRDEEKKKRDAIEFEADQKRQRALKEKGASKPVFYLNTKCGGGYDLATLTERFEMAEPELVTARGAALDYFNIMEKRGARGIFAFRSKMNATTLLSKDEPTADFIKVLCLLSNYNLNPDDDDGKVGFAPAAVICPLVALCSLHFWLVVALKQMDDQASLLEMITFFFVDPKSPLIKENPEFAIYRDVVFLYKLMLAEPTHRRAPKLRRWQKDQATPQWSLKELNKAKTMADLNIAAFGQPSLVIDNKPPYSPADTGSYLPEVKFPTEDDVLHCKTLPSFNDMLSTNHLRLKPAPLTLHSNRHRTLCHCRSGGQRTSVIAIDCPISAHAVSGRVLCIKRSCIGYARFRGTIHFGISSV